MKIKNITFNKLLFSFLYFPWLASWIITSTYFKDIFHPYFIISIYDSVGFSFIALILSNMVKGIFNLKSILWEIAIFLLGCIVIYDNSNASFVLYTFVLLYAGSNINFDWIIKGTIVIQSAIVLFTIFCSLVGIIPNAGGISYAGNIVRFRYCLGFTFSTFASNYLISIVLEYLYLVRQRKLNIVEVVVLLSLNYLIYAYTKTRFAFVLICIAIILYIYLRKIIRVSNLLKMISDYSYIICSSLSFTLTFLYNINIKWMVSLNNLLSERLRFGKMGLQNIGITLFGKSVIWKTDAINYNYIDSSYINIGICYGILVLLIVVLTFTLILRGEDNSILSLVLCLWAVKAFFDPQLFLIWFNPFMFLIGKKLFNGGDIV